MEVGTWEEEKRKEGCGEGGTAGNAEEEDVADDVAVGKVG